MNLLEKKILFKKATRQIKKLENQKNTPSIREIIISLNSVSKKVEKIGE